MSWPLLKYFVKKNWALWLGFLAFLMMELLVCIFMMEEIAEMLPENFLGVSLNGATTLAFVAGLLPLYSSMFVMAYCIFVVFGTLYKPIDSTSMSAHLSCGITRKQYLATAAIFLVSSVFAMFAVVFTVCGLSMLTWGSIDWAAWLNLNFSYFLNIIAVALITFIFASCFAPGKIGKFGMVGLPILFLLFQMLSGYVPLFEYLSPFSWIDGAKIAMGTFGLWWMWDLIFIVFSVASFAAALYIFGRKQLSI